MLLLNLKSASVQVNEGTRANTGHAVLRSTPKPPKMRRRNGPTDGRTDGRTDRPSYRGALQHLKIKMYDMYLVVLESDARFPKQRP